MEGLSELVRDWKLECDCSDIRNSTLQIRHVTNAAEGLWRQRVEERWRRKQELGRGSFGVVWLEKCVSGPSEGQLRAVKELRKAPQSTTSKYYAKELEAIVKFSHERYRDCFVRSFGWFEDVRSIFITMEYVPLGDLEPYLKAPLPEPQARIITRQLLQGLAFMHENKFAHRDLKPGNILVFHEGPKWLVKISDFGISKQVEGTSLRTVIGTPSYLAPEVSGVLSKDGDRNEAKTFSLAVDIWAVGAVVFRAATGRLIFQSPRDLVDYVDSRVPFPVDPSIGPECNRFIAALMDASPRKRPTAELALGDPWLQVHGSESHKMPYIPIREQDEAEDMHEPFSRPTPTQPELPSPAASARWSDTSLNPSLGYELVPKYSYMQPPQDLEGNNTKIWSMSFSSNGQCLASCSTNRTIQLWWADQQGQFQRVQKFKWPRLFTRAFLETLAFNETALSSHGEWLAVHCGQKTIQIWRVGRHRSEECQEVVVTNSYIRRAIFSPDGHLLAVITDGNYVYLWRYQENGRFKLEQSFSSQRILFGTAAISPDSRRLALTVHPDSIIDIWRLDSNGRSQKVQELDEQFDIIREVSFPPGTRALTFSPDGQWLASACPDTSICVWRMSVPDQPEGFQKLYGSPKATKAIAFSPDSKWLASASVDQTICVWRAGPQGWYQHTKHPGQGYGHIYSIAFSSDGQWLASVSKNLKICRFQRDKTDPV